MLTVHTIKLAPLAIVQPRYVDFPYQAWSLEPTGNHVAVLSLRTQRFGVKIEVRPGVQQRGLSCHRLLMQYRYHGIGSDAMRCDAAHLVASRLEHNLWMDLPIQLGVCHGVFASVCMSR